MRQSTAILILTATVALISGCSGKSTSTPPVTTPTLKSGNWLLVETGVSVLSAASGGGSEAFNANLRGSLTFTGDAITGSLSGSDQTPVAYTGTVSESTVTLNSTPDFNGQSFVLTGSINPNATILGTYTIEDGYNGLTSNGTMYATNVPAITGTWTGTLPGGFSGSSTYPVSTLSVSLTQAATASVINNVSAFALSGTASFSNTACTSTTPLALTLDPTASYVSGDEFVFTAYSADFTQSFSWTSRLDNPTLATATSNGTFALSASTCPTIAGIQTGSLTMP